MQQRSSFAVDAKYEELCQEKSLMNKWARDKVNASK